jgi:hypothetical protein
MGSQRHAPVALLPERGLYPPYSRLGKAQGRYAFDPRPVQSVAIRYIDYSIRIRLYANKLSVIRESKDQDNSFILFTGL